jgi:hypothetical protein
MPIQRVINPRLKASDEETLVSTPRLHLRPARNTGTHPFGKMLEPAIEYQLTMQVRDARKQDGFLVEEKQIEGRTEWSDKVHWYMGMTTLKMRIENQNQKYDQDHSNCFSCEYKLSILQKPAVDYPPFTMNDVFPITQ